MASIRKRGKTYQVRVSNGTDSNGNPIIETATFTPEPGMTEKQIKKALDIFALDFERDVKSNQNFRADRMTLKELSESFLKHTEPIEGTENINALSVTTWDCYKYTLNQRIIPKIGHKKVSEITAKLLRDYSNDLRKDGARSDGKPGGLSDNTIQKDCAIVSSLLSFAVSEGLLQLNPIIYAGKHGRHHKRRKEYKVDYFTIEQTKRLLRALDEPIAIKAKDRKRKKKDGTEYTVKGYTTIWKLDTKWRAYFYLALFVGDRRGENLALKWKDIDFDTGEVRIESSTAYSEKKIIQKETKTGNTRSAFVPPIVIEILKLWKKEQKEECIKIGSQWLGERDNFDNNFIFTQWNGKQMHPSSPYHEFKRIIRLYNDNVPQSDDEKIPDILTPHDLRHTAASIMISNNLDPRSVAGVLGHSSTSTTLNIYSYFFKNKIQEAANIMNNILINN